MTWADWHSLGRARHRRQVCLLALWGNSQERDCLSHDLGPRQPAMLQASQPSASTSQPPYYYQPQQQQPQPQQPYSQAPGFPPQGAPQYNYPPPQGVSCPGPRTGHAQCAAPAKLLVVLLASGPVCSLQQSSRWTALQPTTESALVHCSTTHTPATSGSPRRLRATTRLHLPPTMARGRAASPPPSRASRTLATNSLEAQVRGVAARSPTPSGAADDPDPFCRAEAGKAARPHAVGMHASLCLKQGLVQTCDRARGDTCRWAMLLGLPSARWRKLRPRSGS